LILAAFALLPSFLPSLLGLWLALVLLFLGIAGFDWWQLRGIELRGQRTIRRVIAHRQWSPVTLQIDNPGALALAVNVHDLHPGHCQVKGLPQKINLPPRQRSSLHYELQSEQRGDLSFAGIDCQLATPKGLWYRKLTLPVKTEVRVFPNFKANRLYGLLLSRQHLDQAGVRRLPRPGQGSDFNQLREYRNGDSLRLIDWKATARSGKLIAREYQQERDQQIVFLLDCSLRMRHRDTSTSHMDDALNAVVLLAHVALQQGDATGLMTFGGVDRWIPPAKGPHAARRLMAGLYDVEATLSMPDYVAAVQNLAQRLRRRALVILITNLRHEDGDSALRALKRLTSRHLVLMADLRETDLDITSAQTPTNIEEAVLWMSTEAYRQQRKQQHRLAIAGGTRLLDVVPADLSADLITRYLSIKRLGKL
jgi:uncharacterized protein (DUF58 family)